MSNNNATVVRKPAKSKYQFFVRTTERSGVAQLVRGMLPKYTGKADPKKSLIFGYDHPYTGWAGFNLPGNFETRKKIAGIFFREGWKLGVGLELKDGGLAPLWNRNDHSGAYNESKEPGANAGGCAGCENKNPENCGLCPLDYKFRFDGTKVKKVAFDRNTIWEGMPKAYIATA